VGLGVPLEQQEELAVQEGRVGLQEQVVPVVQQELGGQQEAPGAVVGCGVVLGPLAVVLCIVKGLQIYNINYSKV
jgi:hypothetical protein